MENSDHAVMQVMKVTHLIKGQRPIEAELTTIGGKGKFIEGKEKDDLDSIWEEKDVLLRT
ncbi:hypothetical protein KY285_016104 [Solanum tuberosum]|nr:hypothetical protein KY285_016104 [Solanum tuberosum]